jgi:enoyl-CoA hydratase
MPTDEIASARVQTTAHEGGIRVLTLRNIATRNAIDQQMCDELREHIAGIQADASARAVIVTGEPPSFCAGANLATLFGDLSRPVSEIRHDLHGVYGSFLALRALEIPLIAAVNGAAVGAGMNIALCCDIVIAGPTALFSVPFTKIGLHQGGGATSFLVETLGRQKAMRLLLEGGALNAEDAVRLGLAESFADDPLAAAMELAGTIAALDPGLARDIKTSVRRALSGELEQVVEFEAWAQASTAKGPKFAAVVARYRKD